MIDITVIKRCVIVFIVGMPPPHREWLLIEGDALEGPGM